MTIKTHGLQALLARRLKVAKPTINGIFTGHHRATAKMALKLETEFMKLGINITRWDLLYEVKDGQSLADYLEQKEHKNG